jgi:hypothetical protein
VREHSIDCPESTVLDCRCGEQLVLFGSEDDWNSRNAIFVCQQCEEKLTLDERIDEEAPRIEDPVHDVRATHSL